MRKFLVGFAIHGSIDEEMEEDSNIGKYSVNKQGVNVDRGGGLTKGQSLNLTLKVSVKINYFV